VSDPVRVLVVDDHPLLRQGVVATLTSARDFDVVAEASTGAEAVRLAAITKPDLVLLDVGLPDMSGVEVIPLIAAKSPDAKIAILTVADDSETVLEALRAGAAGYLLKGIAGAELVTAVRQIVAGQDYVSPAAAKNVVQSVAHPTRKPELSDREREVLDLLREGLTNREIADRLFLSEKTVKHYVTALMRKLHVRNRVEAAVSAHSARDE